MKRPSFNLNFKMKSFVFYIINMNGLDVSCINYYDNFNILLLHLPQLLYLALKSNSVKPCKE